jgi:hypothetical protein
MGHVFNIHLKEAMVIKKMGKSVTFWGTYKMVKNRLSHPHLGGSIFSIALNLER